MTLSGRALQQGLLILESANVSVTLEQQDGEWTATLSAERSDVTHTATEFAGYPNQAISMAAEELAKKVRDEQQWLTAVVDACDQLSSWTEETEA